MNSRTLKCTSDWTINGKLLCVAGKSYEIRDAAENEGPESEGYCDVLNCEDGGTLMTNWLEIGEHFEELNCN